MELKEIKSSTVITSKEPFIICNSADAIVLTMSSAAGSKTLYYIKNIGTGAVTITPTSPDLVDGDATKVLVQYESTNLLDYSIGVWVVL